jgi:hypothetical protein
MFHSAPGPGQSQCKAFAIPFHVFAQRNGHHFFGNVSESLLSITLALIRWVRRGSLFLFLQFQVNELLETREGPLIEQSPVQEN